MTSFSKWVIIIPMMKDFTKVVPEVIALAGDWHSDTLWAVNAVEVAHEVGAELVISVGDFGYWPQFSHGVHFLDTLTQKLAAYNMTLWFVDGNHEDHAALRELPVDADGLRTITSYIKHIPRGFRWTWDGTTWMGLGGAVSVDRDWREAGVDWFPLEVITEQDATYAVREGNVDVMVTHEATMGVPFLLSGPSSWPADALVDANRVRQRLTEVVETVNPNYLFHGHHHCAYSGDNGHGTMVRGLHCNGSSMSDNLFFVDATGARCA